MVDAIAAPIDNLWFSTAHTPNEERSRLLLRTNILPARLEGCEQVYTDKGYARPEAWAAMQAGVRK